MFSRLFCRTVSQVNPEPLLPVVNQDSSQSTPREETSTRIPSNSGRGTFNRAVRQAQAEAEQKRAHKASMKFAQGRITSAQERLATAMAGADEALAKHGLVTEKKNQLDKKLADAEVNCFQARDKVGNADAACKAATAEVDSAEAACKAATAEVDSAEAACKAATAEVDSAEAACKAATAEVDSAEAACKAATAEVDSTEAACKAATAEVDSAEAACKAATEEVDSAEAAYKAATADVDSAKDVLDRVQVKADSAKNAHTEAVAKLVSAKNAHNEAVAKLGSANNTYEEAAAKLVSAKNAHNEAVAKLGSANNTYEEAAAKLVSAKNAHNEAVAKLGSANNTYEETAAKLDSAKSTYEEAAAKINNAGVELTLAEEALNQAQKEVHSAEGELNEGKTLLKRAVDEFVDLDIKETTGSNGVTTYFGITQSSFLGGWTNRRSTESKNVEPWNVYAYALPCALHTASWVASCASSSKLSEAIANYTNAAAKSVYSINDSYINTYKILTEVAKQKKAQGDLSTPAYVDAYRKLRKGVLTATHDNSNSLDPNSEPDGKFLAHPKNLESAAPVSYLKTAIRVKETAIQGVTLWCSIAKFVSYSNEKWDAKGLSTVSSIASFSSGLVNVCQGWTEYSAAAEKYKNMQVTIDRANNRKTESAEPSSTNAHRAIDYVIQKLQSKQADVNSDWWHSVFRGVYGAASMGTSMYDWVNGGNTGAVVTNTGTLVTNNNATLVPNVTRAMDTNAEAVVTNTGARLANGISNFFAMPYVGSNTKRTQDKLRKQTEPSNSDKDQIVTHIAEFIWNQKNSVPSGPENYGERYLADLNQIYDDKFKELEVLARSATSFEKCKEIFEKGFEV